MQTVWRSLLILLVCAASVASRDRIQIDARLDDSTRTITGTVVVTWYDVDSSYSDPHLRLWGNRLCTDQTKDSTQKCGITLDHEWQVNGTDAVKTMRIDGPADSVRIEIGFTTVVPQVLDRFGHSNGVYALDGWFPMPAPHRHGNWQIVPYDDEAELVGDFYDIQVSFRHTAKLQCIAPGLVGADTTGDTITNHYQLKPAHDFALLLGHDFRLKSFASGDTDVHFYYRSKDETAIDSVAASVLFTLNWMNDHVGPYPFEELVVVEVPLAMTGGVEFPQMYWQSGVSTGEYVRVGRSVAIHETVHQWFYGILASNQAEEPWLDESITEYFSARINAAEMKGEARDVDFFGITATAQIESRVRGYAYLDRLPITRSALAYSGSDYFPTIYGKGPMLIATIVGLLGEREKEFWQSYYRQFLFTHPTESDFVGLLNTYAPFSERQSATELIRLPHALDYQLLGISTEHVTDSNQYRSAIALNAVHPLRYPVKLRLTFPTEHPFDTLITLTPGEQTLTVERGEPAISAQLDPDGIYAIDTDYLNNSYQQQGHGAAFRLFSGITFLVESLISLLWGM